MVSLLLIEDEPAWVDAMHEVLDGDGTKITHIANWEDAVFEARKPSYDRLILDLSLGESHEDGIALLVALNRQRIRTPTLILTGARRRDVLARCAALSFVKNIILKTQFMAELPKLRDFIAGKNFEKTAGTAPDAPSGTRRLHTSLNGAEPAVVFITHGRNKRHLTRIQHILATMRVVPVFVLEDMTGTRSFIEMIEAHRRIDFAVCVLSGDDEGRRKEDPDLKTRARQNVVFEVGYFCGKIGRSNVVLVVDEDVEMPSNIANTKVLSISESADKLRRSFAQAFSAAGVPFHP